MALLTFPLASWSGTARWPTVADVGIQDRCLVEGEEALDIHDGCRGAKALPEGEGGMPAGGASDAVSICSKGG